MPKTPVRFTRGAGTWLGEEAYSDLKQLADRNRRSLSEELRVLIEARLTAAYLSGELDLHPKGARHGQA